MSPRLCLAQDPPADRLLSSDPFALLTGMLLDQQFPMERAFAGPYLLAGRLGDPERLDPAVVVATPDERLNELAAGPPAIHRYPSAMAGRIKNLAAIVVSDYGGDASAIWSQATDGRECLRALKGLPGFGDQKSRIFLALCLKRGLLAEGVEGARAACAPYGEPDTFMSVADVTGPESLIKVREWKQAQKAAAKAKS